MNRYDGIYMLSTGESDEEYGLYLMEVKCCLHTEDTYLLYYFDGDLFIHRDENAKRLFVRPSQLTTCKDEFNNEYSGDELVKRMQKAIQAYKEEFPGYLSYFNKSEELFNGTEMELKRLGFDTSFGL